MYSKKPITHYESVIINDIIKEAVRTVVQKYPAKKVIVEEDMDKTKDHFIEVDPIRMKEVFINILDNSFESMHGDTAIIDIRSGLHGSNMVITVKDNGIGIARKDLKNVASPFFTTKMKGTGLGLAVCKQVVILHGGSITFNSVPGAGTVVKITLPIHKRPK